MKFNSKHWRALTPRAVSEFLVFTATGWLVGVVCFIAAAVEGNITMMILAWLLGLYGSVTFAAGLLYLIHAVAVKIREEDAEADKS